MPVSREQQAQRAGLLTTGLAGGSPETFVIPMPAPSMSRLMEGRPKAKEGAEERKGKKEEAAERGLEAPRKDPEA